MAQRAHREGPRIRAVGEPRYEEQGTSREQRYSRIQQDTAGYSRIQQDTAGYGAETLCRDPKRSLYKEELILAEFLDNLLDCEIVFLTHES